MLGIGNRALSLASPRVLLSSFLLLGLVSAQGGRGTLAYFTQSVVSNGSSFTGGQLVLNTSTLNGGLFTDTTGAATQFSWTATAGGVVGGSSNCNTAGVAYAPGFTGNAQPFVPGTYCVAPITLTNSGTIDMWGRLRVIVSTLTDNSGSAANLNKALQLYVSEYTSAPGTDCTPANFKPTAASSSGQITNSASPSRTALPTLGISGKAFGATQLNSTTTLGMGLANAVATINEANTTTAQSGAINGPYYYNLIGNDAVSGEGSSNSFAAGDGGALFPQGQSRYYCAAAFFPADTDPNASLGGGAGHLDNSAQTASVMYKFEFVGAQRSGRLGGQVFSITSGQSFTAATCSSGCAINVTATGFSGSSLSFNAIQADTGTAVSLTGTQALSSGGFGPGTVSLTGTLTSGKQYYLRATDGTATVTSTNTFSIT